METSTTLFTKFPQAGVLSLTDCCLTLSLLVPWEVFPKSLGNFSGPKSNIQIEISGIKVQVLASKLPHFVSLTDDFIMFDANLLKPLSCT